MESRVRCCSKTTMRSLISLDQHLLHMAHVLKLIMAMLMEYLKPEVRALNLNRSKAMAQSKNQVKNNQMDPLSNSISKVFMLRNSI